ncbi:MAG: hypothetical protein ACKOX3_05275 [Bacteroidota bacterium]
MKYILAIAVVVLFFTACKDDDTSTPQASSPKLIIKIEVDSTLDRLGNNGLPVLMPAGHAGQNPVFSKIAAHYLEFSQNANTMIGAGDVLYHAEETTQGGTTAIDFSKSKLITPGQTFLTLPLSDLSAGTYQYARMSLSYQNYDVKFYFAGMPFTGRVASFVGYNTYIGSYKIKDSTVNVNANKLQGYWGVETMYNVTTGQSPAGATTVPNPIFNTSPIPAGSCLVTGQFNTPLVITGNETNDVTVTMKLSINKSFEWIDINGNGKWDVDVAGETVVDMGLRGLFPVH